jgi:small subunit ribosomal protein S15
MAKEKKVSSPKKKEAKAPKTTKSAPKKKSVAVFDFLTASKTEIIAQFGINEKDSGSPEVQVALLTQRIEQLATHLKTHKKDNHSRRGILQLVGKRRRMLLYLSKQHPERYEAVLAKVGLKK